MIILRILTRVLVAGTAGAVIGLLVAHLTGLSRLPSIITEGLPYPHVVPKTPDGAALRFAMIHDVLHERLPRHGLAFYQERNHRTRKALDSFKTRPRIDQASQEYFDLLDDLAVGLNLAGEHEEAIRLLRDKLRQQQELDLPRKKRYSTYANLGTFLILGPFRKVRPGHEDDKAALREGLKCIQTAIEINPDSHFGREIWQAVLIEYMLALYDNPELLVRFDMIGNRLDMNFNIATRSPMSDFGHQPGEPGPLQWGAKYGGVALSRQAVTYLDQPESWEKYRKVREGIATVGAEECWIEAVASSHKKPVPFDEPTLGIV
ncbi:MAG: hypothetical protein ACRCZF_16120, partial [Gemmataceae bacterium]